VAKANKLEGADRVDGGDAKAVAERVRFVYHLSQIAAIRSLVPTMVNFDEAQEMCEGLDRLVSEDILESGLDSCTRQDVFPLLTLNYSLGKSNDAEYTDDAYYPLAVRSLSGLLTRTIDVLGQSASDEEVLSLTDKFREALARHYTELLKRRPEKLDEDDSHVWANAPGKPYVLYATQRSIFALLQYKDFLQAVAKAESQRLGGADPETKLCDMLAQSMVTTLFRPMVKELVKLVGAAAIRPDDVAASAPVWSKETLEPWLKGLSSMVSSPELLKRASDLATELLGLMKSAREYVAPANMNNQKKKVHLRDFQNTIDNNIKISRAVLEAAQKPEDLFAEIFAQLFTDAGRKPDEMLSHMQSPNCDLAKQIKAARTAQDELRKGETAN
jgi:hypothetical protein